MALSALWLIYGKKYYSFRLAKFEEGKEMSAIGFSTFLFQRSKFELYDFGFIFKGAKTTESKSS